MATWVLRFNIRDKNNFEEIRRGLKTIETRAATERYRRIRSGDMIIFACGKSRLKKRVLKTKRFRTIGAMVKVVGFRKIMPSCQNIAEVRKTYFSYHGYEEKIKKFGMVVFWLE